MVSTFFRPVACTGNTETLICTKKIVSRFVAELYIKTSVIFQLPVLWGTSNNSFQLIPYAIINLTVLRIKVITENKLAMPSPRITYIKMFLHIAV